MRNYFQNLPEEKSLEVIRFLKTYLAEMQGLSVQAYPKEMESAPKGKGED